MAQETMQNSSLPEIIYIPKPFTGVVVGSAYGSSITSNDVINFNRELLEKARQRALELPYAGIVASLWDRDLMCIMQWWYLMCYWNLEEIMRAEDTRTTNLVFTTLEMRLSGTPTTVRTLLFDTLEAFMRPNALTFSFQLIHGTVDSIEELFQHNSTYESQLMLIVEEMRHRAQKGTWLAFDHSKLNEQYCYNDFAVFAKRLIVQRAQDKQ